MKIKTSELTGAALDFAVAKCENVSVGKVPQEPHGFLETAWHPVTKWEDAGEIYTPSTNWSEGGPIIEREEISTVRCRISRGPVFWEACVGFEDEPGHALEVGPTPLIAAMRCYVASKLGDEVDVPEELS